MKGNDLCVSTRRAIVIRFGGEAQYVSLRFSFLESSPERARVGKGGVAGQLMLYVRIIEQARHESLRDRVGFALSSHESRGVKGGW